MSSNEQLSKEKENKLKDIFYLVDQDKDNKIDTNEVGVTLRALGIYLSQEDISQITNEIDPSGCGKVTYEQFKDLYITKLSTNKKVNDLVKAFKSFDKERLLITKLAKKYEHLASFEDLYSERKNGGDSYIIDKQVDAIIYELFGLDSEEIAYLEREV